VCNVFCKPENTESEEKTLEKPTKTYRASNSKKPKKKSCGFLDKFAKIARFVINKAMAGSIQHIAILVAAAVLVVAVVGGTVWGITSLAGGNGGNTVNEIEIDPEADNKYDKDANIIDTSKYASTILQETQDAGQQYITETLFVGDSNTVRSLMYDVTGNTWENVVGAVGIGIQHVVSDPVACVTFTQPADPVDIVTAIKWIQPKRVVFTFGTNNASWTADSFIEEYKKAVDAAYQAYPYFDIIINAIPPVDKVRDYPNVTMQQIDAFNAALAQMCEEKGYKFLNSAEALKDEATGFAKKDYTISDGIHLSKNGFTALFDYIRTHALETADRRPELTYCPKRNEIEMPTILQDPIAIRGGLKVIFTSNDYTLGSVDGEVEQYVKYTKTSDAVTAVAKSENGGIFTGWSCEYNGISDPNASTITFTAPQLSEEITTVTITANFKKGDVDISKNSLSLIVGQTSTLTASASGGYDIEWSSSNEKVAKVSSKGVVTAVGPGTAKITASAMDGAMSASCTVSVTEPAASVLESITIKTADDVKEIKIGESLDISIVTKPEKAQLGTVEWTSSDPTVATVAKNGATNKISALKAGKTTITASTNEGKLTDKIEITVVDPNAAAKLTSIVVNPVTVEVGKTANLNVTCNPSNAKVTSKVYSTSDTSVATINKDGVVTGVKEGTATITATFDGIVGTTTVTVTASKPTVVEVTGFDVSVSAASIDVGGSAKVSVSNIAPSNATNTTASYTSSNTSVATVDGSGNVAGVAAGSATITVKIGNITKTVDITVKSPVVAETCPQCGQTKTDACNTAYCTTCQSHAGHEANAHCASCGKVNDANCANTYCTTCQSHAGHEADAHCSSCGKVNDANCANTYCTTCQSHAGHEAGAHCSECGTVNCSTDHNASASEDNGSDDTDSTESIT